jgi:hypothetical protein
MTQVRLQYLERVAVDMNWMGVRRQVLKLEDVTLT